MCLEYLVVANFILPGVGLLLFCHRGAADVDTFRRPSMRTRVPTPKPSFELRNIVPQRVDARRAAHLVSRRYVIIH